MNILAVAVGGFFGSILRFYISTKWNKRLIGTWIANISGAVLLAFIIYAHSTSRITESTWLIFGVGFCGAYTTFSTFGNEVLQLLLQKQYVQAIWYVFSSLLIAFSIVWVILISLGYQF
jgi:fluoride exporter